MASSRVVGPSAWKTRGMLDGAGDADGAAVIFGDGDGDEGIDQDLFVLERRLAMAVSSSAGRRPSALMRCLSMGRRM